MNLDLEKQLKQSDVTYEQISKSQKVTLLARWVKTFPELVAAARHQQDHDAVYHDNGAWERYARLPAGQFYVLPDDDSGMPAYACSSVEVPDLSELVSDTFTKCDELVLVDINFRWSAVFVNHGTPELVGRHFMLKDTDIESRKIGGRPAAPDT